MKYTLFFLLLAAFSNLTCAQEAPLPLNSPSEVSNHNVAHDKALNIDFNQVNINDIVDNSTYSKEEKIQIYHQYNRVEKAKLLAQKEELISLMKKAHMEHEATHKPIDPQEKANIIEKKNAFISAVESFKEQNRHFKISLGLPLNHPHKNESSELHLKQLPLNHPHELSNNSNSNNINNK